MRPIRLRRGNVYLEIGEARRTITDLNEAIGLMIQLRISGGEHDYSIEIKPSEVHFRRDLAFEMLGNNLVNELL
jgi:hypothetical protein